jgi:hypothetical protein
MRRGPSSINWSPVNGASFVRPVFVIGHMFAPKRVICRGRCVSDPMRGMT